MNRPAFIRMFRLLAACLEALNNAHPDGAGCAIVAKEQCRYTPDDIGKLRGDHPIAGPGKASFDLRYDTYYRLIVCSPPAAVRHLTGHDRAWWLTQERRAEAG